MNIEQLLTKTRSYRRFYQDKPVTSEQLASCIRAASLTPSGGNKMPLKYITSTAADINAKIFDCVGWAAYLPDWNGPEEGEKPTGYIVMLRDTSISKATATDEGIQALAIMMSATEQGLGGCIMGNIQREKLAAALGISAPYEIALVLALGEPKEQVIMERVPEDGNIKYWHDAQGTHHVPKRTAEEILVKNYE
ncbi:MAG: nitroreductase family protein [Treponema sp.]|nr:nitroreductase family protein [Treponema sp.]